AWNGVRILRGGLSQGRDPDGHLASHSLRIHPPKLRVRHPEAAQGPTGETSVGPLAKARRVGAAASRALGGSCAHRGGDRHIVPGLAQLGRGRRLTYGSAYRSLPQEQLALRIWRG